MARIRLLLTLWSLIAASHAFSLQTESWNRDKRKYSFRQRTPISQNQRTCCGASIQPTNAAPRNGHDVTTGSVSATTNWITQTLIPALQFTLFSFGLALLLVAWEDVTCQNTLSSRHRTSYLAEAQRQHALPWGHATVRGMGFGRDERTFLLKAASTSEQPLLELRSYNEVLLEHRLVRVPQWRRDWTRQAPQDHQQASYYYADAIHTVCDCLASLFTLKEAIRDYQWPLVRQTLAAAPWTGLDRAASRLRSVDPAVGFDWGSCAWRSDQCRALADTQESLDELNFLLGVLEPREALFCLDIVERSLREILAEVPWEYASTEDAKYWNTMVPPYQPHRVFDPVLEQGEGGDDTAIDRIDDEYIEALRLLRID